MSIRDRVRRALRNKSDSASDSDSASQSDSSLATPITSNTSQSSDSGRSLTSKLSRTFTWSSHKDGSRSSSGSGSKDKSRRKRPLHPSERPLTAQNLRHQQMLGQFTMTFGTSNLSQLDLDGVSPCCTRAPSIDGLGIDPMYSQPGRTNMSEDEIAPA